MLPEFILGLRHPIPALFSIVYILFIYFCIIPWTPSFQIEYNVLFSVIKCQIASKQATITNPHPPPPPNHHHIVLILLDTIQLFVVRTVTAFNRLRLFSHSAALPSREDDHIYYYSYYLFQRITPTLYRMVQQPPAASACGSDGTDLLSCRQT